MGTIRLTALAIMILVQAAAQQNQQDPTIRLPLNPNAVLDNLEAHAVAAISRVQHPHTRRAVEDRRQELIKHFTKSLGFSQLPWPPDLRAVVTGKLQQE